MEVSNLCLFKYGDMCMCEVRYNRMVIFDFIFWMIVCDDLTYNEGGIGF